MFWKRPPPGMNTCVPASRCSVMPFRRNSMPRVVMNDGTRRNVVITPLVSPTRQDTASAASIPTQIGSPCSFVRRDDVDDRGGEGVHATQREVDLAADQEHRLTRRDQRDRGHRLGDVLEVVGRVERRALDREVDAQEDRDDEDARLAAPDERTRDAPAEAGASFGCDRLCCRGSLKCYPETGYFCALELPWYRVFVVRYGLTLAFVTNRRPVFVSDGATRPPESRWRNSCMTG